MQSQASSQVGSQTWQYCPHGTGYKLMENTQVRALGSLSPQLRKAAEDRKSGPGQSLLEGPWSPLYAAIK